MFEILKRSHGLNRLAIGVLLREAKRVNYQVALEPVISLQIFLTFARKHASVDELKLS